MRKDAWVGMVLKKSTVIFFKDDVNVKPVYSSLDLSP